MNISYVYKYAVKGGNDLWQWQQKDTFVWASARTEKIALEQIREDATRRGATYSVRDVGLLRPAREGYGAAI